jgi:hypothetical protein
MLKKTLRALNVSVIGARALILTTCFYSAPDAVAATIASGAPIPARAAGLWDMTETSADGTASPRTYQVCVTYDPSVTAERKTSLDRLRTAMPDQGYKRSNEQRTTTSSSFDFVRSIGVMPGSGRMQISFPDDKHRSIKRTFKGTTNSVPINIDTTTTMTWIGADCGSVKPVIGIPAVADQ